MNTLPVSSGVISLFIRKLAAEAASYGQNFGDALLSVSDVSPADMAKGKILIESTVEGVTAKYTLQRGLTIDRFIEMVDHIYRTYEKLSPTDFPTDTEKVAALLKLYSPSNSIGFNFNSL